MADHIAKVLPLLPPPPRYPLICMDAGSGEVTGGGGGGRAGMDTEGRGMSCPEPTVSR